MRNGKFIRNVVQRGSSQCDSVLRAKHVFPYRSLSSTDKEIYDDGAKRPQYVRIRRRGRKCSKERPWRWSQRVGPDHQGRMSTQHRPRSSRTDVNAAWVQELILENRPWFQDASAESGLSIRTLHDDVCDELKYRKK